MPQLLEDENLIWHPGMDDLHGRHVRPYYGAPENLGDIYIPAIVGYQETASTAQVHVQEFGPESVGIVDDQRVGCIQFFRHRRSHSQGVVAPVRQLLGGMHVVLYTGIAEALIVPLDLWKDLIQIRGVTGDEAYKVSCRWNSDFLEILLPKLFLVRGK